MLRIDLVEGAGGALLGYRLITGDDHLVKRHLVDGHLYVHPGASRNGHCHGVHTEETDFQDGVCGILYLELPLAVPVGDGISLFCKVLHCCAGDWNAVGVNHASLYSDRGRILSHRGEWHQLKQQNRERGH